MQNAMREETLLFVVDRAAKRILLAMKKVRFGAGKYNGTGGRVEEGETRLEAAVRETKEEVGLIIPSQSVVKAGRIKFSFDGKPEWSRVVHVFVSEVWEGEPQESDEMAPQWFEFDEVPYEKMWIDDKLWLPAVIDGGAVDAEFHFNVDGSEILRHVAR